MDIPDEWAGLVSDDARALASSEALSAAREAWDNDRAFLDQVDYQLDFRTKSDYLSIEPEHLDLVLSQRRDNSGYRAIGLYMSDAEAAEFDRRLALGDRMESVTSLVTGVPVDVLSGDNPPEDMGGNFGGVWMDQMDSGVLVLAVRDASLLDRSAIERAVGGSQYIKILDAQPSLAVIRAEAGRLLERLTTAGVEAHVSVLSGGDGKFLRVVTTDAAAANEVIDQHRDPTGPDIEIREGTLPRKTGDPQDLHDWANMMPGLAIAVRTLPWPGKACTWGGNLHTGGGNHLVTAGHCLDTTWQNISPAQDTALVDVSQTLSSSLPRILTPGYVKVRSIVSYNYDFTRIESPYADDNCYHFLHCSKWIWKRAAGFSWDVNSDISCASLGKSDLWRCGYVRGTRIDYYDPGLIGRYVMVEVESEPGDSGSGFIGTTGGGASYMDGILVFGNDPDFSWFNTAYDVKTHIGGDWNCASAPLYNPSNWGNCASVNR